MGYLGIDNDSNASSEISTDTTNFDNILSVADDTVTELSKSSRETKTENIFYREQVALKDAEIQRLLND